MKQPRERIRTVRIHRASIRYRTDTTAVLRKSCYSMQGRAGDPSYDTEGQLIAMNQGALGKAVLAGAIAFAAVSTVSGCTSNGTGAGAGASTSAGASSRNGAGAGSTTTAGGQSTSSSTGGPTSESGTSACANGQLSVHYVSAGAAAGHTGYILTFTNTSSSSCTVQGYPGAGVTDHFDKVVVLNATRSLGGYMGGGYSSPATITLAPGAVASTVLEWLDAPLNGQTPVGADCPGMDDGKLLITPPNTTASTSFSAPANLCAGFYVHPLISGSSGRPMS
jgi:hypothetical protein